MSARNFIVYNLLFCLGVAAVQQPLQARGKSEQNSKNPAELIVMGFEGLWETPFFKPEEYAQEQNLIIEYPEDTPEWYVAVLSSFISKKSGKDVSKDPEFLCMLYHSIARTVMQGVGQVLQVALQKNIYGSVKPIIVQCIEQTCAMLAEKQALIARHPDFAMQSQGKNLLSVSDCRKQLGQALEQLDAMLAQEAQKDKSSAEIDTAKLADAITRAAWIVGSGLAIGGVSIGAGLWLSGGMTRYDNYYAGSDNRRTGANQVFQNPLLVGAVSDDVVREMARKVQASNGSSDGNRQTV